MRIYSLNGNYIAVRIMLQMIFFYVFLTRSRSCEKKNGNDSNEINAIRILILKRGNSFYTLSVL